MDEILVAVDGSDHSLKVVDYASKLAKDLASEILLVSVVNLPSKEEPEAIAAFEKVEHYPDAYAQYLETLSLEVTNRLSDRLKDAGVKSVSATPSGNAAAEILHLAERQDVKMIVIGLRGLHGIAKVRSLGSVARRVIENSTKPVLVVP